MEEISKDLEMAAHEKYAQFKHLVNENIIKLPQLADQTIAKIRNILQGLVL